MPSLRASVSTSLKTAAWICWFGSGLYGIVLIFPHVVTPLYSVFEGWIGYLAILPVLVLLPVIFSLGPFYLLLTKGMLLPIIAIYGGWVPFTVFTWLAESINDSQ